MCARVCQRAFLLKFSHIICYKSDITQIRCLNVCAGTTTFVVSKLDHVLFSIQSNTDVRIQWRDQDQTSPISVQSAQGSRQYPGKVCRIK